MDKLLKMHFISIEECEKFIRETSYVLYFLAVTSLAYVLFFHHIGAISDIYFLTISAWAINKYKSRSLSIIIFLYSILCSITTFYNNINNISAGKNIILSIIVVIVAFTLMRATFAYYRFSNLKTSIKNVIIKFMIAVIYCITSFIIYSFIVYFGIKNFDNTRDGLILSLMFISSFLFAFLGFFPFGRKVVIHHKMEFNTIQENINNDSFLNKTIYKY